MNLYHSNDDFISNLVEFFNKEDEQSSLNSQMSVYCKRKNTETMQFTPPEIGNGMLYCLASNTKISECLCASLRTVPRNRKELDF